MRDLPQFEERERDKVRAAYDSFLVYDNRPSNYQASVEQGNQGFVDMSDVLGVLFLHLSLSARPSQWTRIKRRYIHCSKSSGGLKNALDTDVKDSSIYKNRHSCVNEL